MVRYTVPVIKWAVVGVLAALVLFVLAAVAHIGWRNYEDRKARPLVEAAYHGDEEQVRELLEAGVNPNGRTFKDRRALNEAAEKGHTEVVRLLLDHGAEPTEWAMERSRENGFEKIATLIERRLIEERGHDEAGQSE